MRLGGTGSALPGKLVGSRDDIIGLDARGYFSALATRFVVGVSDWQAELAWRGSAVVSPVCQAEWEPSDCSWPIAEPP